MPSMLQFRTALTLGITFPGCSHGWKRVFCFRAWEFWPQKDSVGFFKTPWNVDLRIGFNDYTLENQDGSPKNHPALKSGKSSEPKLHDFGLKMLIFRGGFRRFTSKTEQKTCHGFQRRFCGRWRYKVTRVNWLWVGHSWRNHLELPYESPFQVRGLISRDSCFITLHIKWCIAWLFELSPTSMNWKGFIPKISGEPFFFFENAASLFGCKGESDDRDDAELTYYYYYYYYYYY